MKYSAMVVDLDEDVEEVVQLRVEGFLITCFSSLCPYQISKGLLCSVNLQLMVFDDYKIELCHEFGEYGFRRMGEGLGYVVCGRVNGNKLEVGSIEFEDDVLMRDYWFYDGKCVLIKVDRIDAEFLK